MSTDPNKTVTDFKLAVNITAGQLKKWLETDKSKEVGSKNDGTKESVGHQMGHTIIEILGKKKEDYTVDDYKNMAKVVGYVHRHQAQRPEGDTKETPWRYSLMNWAHDPLKTKNDALFEASINRSKPKLVGSDDRDQPRV